MPRLLKLGTYVTATGLKGFGTTTRLRCYVVEVLSDGIHANVRTADPVSFGLPLTLRVDTLEPAHCDSRWGGCKHTVEHTCHCVCAHCFNAFLYDGARLGMTATPSVTA